MQKLKRSRSKKVTNLNGKHSRKSIKSDNLRVPLTPSTFRKIKTSASRHSTTKSRSVVGQRKSVGEREPLVRLSQSRPSEVPENVAVHFASFYQNKNQTLPHSNGEKAFGLQAKTSRNFPKMEFTRQMVYKLEHSAGTHDYGRQVSSVLENTVESPDFNLKLPPVDNCSPSNKSNDFPLWYKDPNNISQISRVQFQKMKDRFKRKMPAEVFEKEIRKVKESVSDSSETEVDTESEEDESDWKDCSKFLQVKEPHLSTKSSKSSRITARSTTSTTDSRFQNSLVNINTKSISSSSSEHSSWSSNTSCEIEDENYEKESLDWETEVEEEEEEEEGKVVRYFHKKLYC